jgi:hypothetical protein
MHRKLRSYHACRQHSKAAARHRLLICRCKVHLRERVVTPAGLALLVPQEAYDAQYPQVFPHVIPERLARF